MGLFTLSQAPDIHQGLDKYKNTKDAILLDVRTPDEYAQGRIPGSINLPLQVFAKIEEVAPDKSTPLFVYCHSGARSSRFAKTMKKMGYTDVTDIGGIIQYKGEREK